MSHLARRQKPISTHKIGVQGAKPLAGGPGVTPGLSPLPTRGGHSSRNRGAGGKAPCRGSGGHPQPLPSSHRRWAFIPRTPDTFDIIMNTYIYYRAIVI